MTRAERRQRARENQRRLAEIRQSLNADKEPDTVQGWLNAAEMAGFYFDYAGEARDVYVLYADFEKRDAVAVVLPNGDEALTAIVT